jgi:hypothetical protein
MKAKYIKIIGIVLLTIPLSIQAQEKKTETSKEEEVKRLTEKLENQIAAASLQKRNGNTLKEITSYTGEITKWLYNLNYVYNAFELKVGNKTFVVEIPTKLGDKIRSLGNTVTVNGFIKENKNYSEEVINFVSIQAKGKIIYKEEGESFSFSSPDEFRNGKGKVTVTQYNNKGEAIGIIVDNYTVLRIPKHAANQISSMVQVGKTTVEYTGMEWKLNEGEVMRDKYKLIHCHTITIDGTQYLVR